MKRPIEQLEVYCPMTYPLTTKIWVITYTLHKHEVSHSYWESEKEAKAEMAWLNANVDLNYELHSAYLFGRGTKIDH